MAALCLPSTRAAAGGSSAISVPSSGSGTERAAASSSDSLAAVGASSETTIPGKRGASSQVGVSDTSGLLMCAKQIVASSAFVPWLYPDLCPAGWLHSTAPGGPRGAELRASIRSRCTAVARIVVVADRPLVSPDKARAAIAVPPGSTYVNNQRAICAVQLDATVKVCPPGYCLFYASTEIDTSRPVGLGAAAPAIEESEATEGTTAGDTFRKVLEQRAASAIGSLRRLVRLLADPASAPISATSAAKPGEPDKPAADVASRADPSSAPGPDPGSCKKASKSDRPRIIMQVCHAEVLPLAPAAGSE